MNDSEFFSSQPAYSVVTVETPPPLKPLLIRRRENDSGPAGIEFESVEFNRKFYVEAKDRRWAYHVLHPRAMEFLMARPPCKIALGRRGIIVWDGNIWEARQIQEAIETACGFLENFPDYLITDLQEFPNEVS